MGGFTCGKTKQIVESSFRCRDSGVVLINRPSAIDNVLVLVLIVGDKSHSDLVSDERSIKSVRKARHFEWLPVGELARQTHLLCC